MHVILALHSLSEITVKFLFQSEGEISRDVHRLVLFDYIYYWFDLLVIDF